MHVLLIDDEADFTDSIQRVFEDARIPLDLARTWQEGYKKFQVSLHELVIADYNLPESDNGLKLLARIKQLKPSSKLILISGLIASVPADKIKIQGLVDDYFEKNIDVSAKLIEEAKEAIEKAKSKTDWKSFAKMHMAGIKIEGDFIREIDDLLRKDVGRK